MTFAASTGPIAVVLLATLAAAGCGAGRSSHPFIAKSKGGPVEVAVDPKKPRVRLAPGVFEAARAEALRRRAATEPKPLPTIEGVDRRLHEALAALQAAPTPANHVRAAHEYFRVQVFDQALEQYDLALEKAPTLVAALDGRARVWRDMGLLGFALGDAQRAKFHGPRDPAVRNTLGTIHLALGQIDLARKEFGEALRLDPDAGYAKQNIKMLEHAYGASGTPGAVRAKVPQNHE